MFTGIIEEVGIIESITHGSKNAIITIKSKTVTSNTKIGASISVNGVCLTIVQFNAGKSFSADISFETLRQTTFKYLDNGSKVNLERALALGDRLDGHIVAGHVDAQGTLENVEQKDGHFLLRFSFPQEIAKYIVNKGSIAIDGISLTVFNVTQNTFEVAIIPHTYDNTTLRSLSIGSNVNLESDTIAKYVERMVTPYANSHNSDEKSKPASINSIYFS